MKIELNKIKVRDLVAGYENNGHDGVVAYGGRLDVRPKYQREFIYNDKQQEAVISTLRQGFPLNVMYWAKREDGSYEIIDGQQRTISICQYISGKFAFEFNYFHSLQPDEQVPILDYELQIYICEGTDSERLKWFKTINIAGEKLTDQELRNAVYAGEWLSDAKRYFSQNNCPAYRISKDYVKGVVNRQELLEEAISWISKGRIEHYMSQHQKDKNATELWIHFQKVVAWAKATFPRVRKELKSVDWGSLYDRFGSQIFDHEALSQDVDRLMKDDDVTKKSGIYEYLLSGEEKHLNIRAFTQSQKEQAYDKQKGVCPRCKKEGRKNFRYEIEFMEADHIKPWCEGGKTELKNCQMLCKEHNRSKGAN